MNVITVTARRYVPGRPPRRTAAGRWPLPPGADARGPVARGHRFGPGHGVLR